MSIVLRLRNFAIKEGIQRLREIGMLDWIYPAHSPPKYISFLLQSCEKYICEGSPGLLEEVYGNDFL